MRADFIVLVLGLQPLADSENVLALASGPGILQQGNSDLHHASWLSSAVAELAQPSFTSDPLEEGLDPAFWSLPNLEHGHSTAGPSSVSSLL